MDAAVDHGPMKPAQTSSPRTMDDRPAGVPTDWVRKPSKNEGVQYVDPKDAGNSVRIQHGNPNSTNVGQRVDYVRWQKNGRALDKNGNVVVKDSLEAHIPVKDFKFIVEIFK